MSTIKSLKFVSIMAVALFFATTAYARDFGTLQSAVTYAQESMEKAKAEHAANVQEVHRQEKVIADQKKQLAEQTRQLEEAHKNTDQAWKKYQEAKEKYEKAQAALDEAWNKK